MIEAFGQPGCSRRSADPKPSLLTNLLRQFPGQDSLCSCERVCNLGVSQNQGAPIQTPKQEGSFCKDTQKDPSLQKRPSHRARLKGTRTQPVLLVGSPSPGSLCGEQTQKSNADDNNGTCRYAGHSGLLTTQDFICRGSGKIVGCGGCQAQMISVYWNRRLASAPKAEKQQSKQSNKAVNK